MKVNLFDFDDRTLEDIIVYVLTYHNEDIHNNYILEKIEMCNNNLNLLFVGDKIINFNFAEVKILSQVLLIKQLSLDLGVVDLIQKYTRTNGFNGPRVKDFRIDFVGDSFIEFSADEAWLEINR